MSAILRQVVDDARLLTGGCGFAGIDVADNDHVDVHLCLTKKKRKVSRRSIKIIAIIVTMQLMEGG